jgi:hypothetical protein
MKITKVSFFQLPQEFDNAIRADTRCNVKKKIVLFLLFLYALQGQLYYRKTAGQKSNKSPEPRINHDKKSAARGRCLSQYAFMDR